MGILDDAIREHLELKRQLGAREAEIKQLEDEAFGLPARPGEPEFGEQPSSELGAELAELDRGPGPAELPIEARRTADPSSREADPPSEDLDEWLSGFPPDSADAGKPGGEAQSGARSGAEHARGRFPELDDTTSHEPAPEPPPEPDSTEAEATEGEFDELDVGEPDPRSEEGFDQRREGGGGEQRAAEAPAEPGSGREARSDGTERGESAREPEPADDTGESDDLLEEMPEFLRDAPESDRLWFEQGEPEDFDFDDE